MTETQLLQLTAALIAVGTPWCVVRVALAVASRHAESVRAPFVAPRVVAQLGRITIAALVLVAPAAAWLPPQSPLMIAIDAAGFIGLSILGLRALGEIQDLSRPACEVDATTRAATLRPRRLHQYLALPWRLLPLAVTAAGLALYAWRVALPQPDRRLWMSVSFAGYAVVFLWLYETWLRSQLSAGHSEDVAGDDARHRRQLRMIFTIELVVISGCLAIAHLLLDLNWSVNGAWGAALSLAGAAVGVAGCAFALSSDLVRRRYRPVA